MTTTTTGTALDATQGKRLSDTATVHRNDINANKTLANSKQNAINSASSLIAGTITVNASADSDSLSNKVPTMKWVRDYVQRTTPSFIDFPYDTTYFSFNSQFTPKAGAFRRLFTPGAGITINYATGEITSTATGGGSTNVVTGTDPNNTGSTATFLLPPANGGRVFIGNASLQPYALNFRYVSTLENVPGFKSNLGNLGFGLDADATILRINNVVSFNSSSTGTGTDNGYKFYGSPSRYMQINEANGDKAPVLVRITTAGQVGIGTETPTANLDVVGTAKVSGAAQIGGQLTATGGIKFGDGTTLTTAPTGGGSSVTTFANTLSELAAATTRLVVYDGSHWVRVAGNVGTDPGANNFYYATQYNSGSDHYERQFMGRAKFEWWKPSSSNTWEQLKYATNSRLPIQLSNGDYYFNQLVYITPGTQVYGHSTSPDSVRLHINGSTPQLFTSWYWFDGNVAGKRAENIVFDGFTLYQESSYVAKRDTNDFYGPIAIDGGGSFNNVIRNIKYKQVSTTAIVNAIVVKMGTQKPCESLLIDNVQSLTSTVKGRMLVEVLNQGDRNNGQPERIQIPAKNVEIRNCVADGFRFGLSIAGYFDKPYVHHNIVRNCTDYGIEFAGPLVGGRCEINGFGGTQNVLIAGNYYADQTADWVFPVGTGQRYVGNFTEGKVTGGYVEIRSGGTIDFSDNNFQIDGGVLLQNTTFAGVRGGQFTRNRIISTMTNTNWRSQAKAILLMNGATGLDVSANYLERGGTDADALIQSNANGVSSVSNRFYGNTYSVGTNGTYYSNTSTTAVRYNNFDVTGTARN